MAGVTMWTACVQCGGTEASRDAWENQPLRSVGFVFSKSGLSGSPGSQAELMLVLTMRQLAAARLVTSADTCLCSMPTCRAHQVPTNFSGQSAPT